jgi:hypothetical protein
MNVKFLITAHSEHITICMQAGARQGCESEEIELLGLWTATAIVEYGSAAQLS